MTMRVLQSLVQALAATAILASCSGVEPPLETDSGRPRPSARAEKSQQEATKDRAPNFTIETFDGATFRLSDHRGTPVVLNFWESW